VDVRAFFFFEHALIYSPIHASRLYSKHPLAFSVEQRKPFGSEGILSYVRFLHTLPFRIYIPSMLSDTRDKKKKVQTLRVFTPRTPKSNKKKKSRTEVSSR
jgi:hypothetical protein